MKNLKEIKYTYLVLPHIEKRICLLFVTIIATLIIVLGIGLGISNKNASNYRTGKRGFRLPTNVVPHHYSLEMQPYLIPDFFKFFGKVAIYLHCVEETDEIVLHGKQLVLKKYKLIEGDTNHTIAISNVEYDSNIDFVIFSLGQKLKTGKNYTLNISFVGDFSRSINGFFVYGYENVRSETRYAAVTSFEPHFARTAFPCFDEPAMKATFNITIVRWKNMTSLSNMPSITHETRGKDWVADIYNTSVIMSTCYVAMFVGEYKMLRKGRVYLWTPAYSPSYQNFALDTAVQILSYYERILGVPYPLNKLDIVFAAGFSGGLGMIAAHGILIHDFHVQHKFLESQRIRIVLILANKIAQQWFGNLVTQKWWDDNWLTITMVGLLEREVLRNITTFDPQIGSLESTFLYTTDVDCNKEKNASSISKKVDSLEDLTYEDVYDLQTVYMKGSKMVDMLMHFLTREVFWNGLRTYLKANLHGSVDSDTLWHYLSQAAQSRGSKLDLKTMMQPWIQLKGRPIINVVRSYTMNIATVSQVSCRASFSEESKNDLWGIPITVTTAKNTTLVSEKWFLSRSTTIKGMPGKKQWILVNDKDIGNYYVNYDRINWMLLAGQLQLNHLAFDSEQRLKLLHDVYVAAQKGNIKAGMVCQFYMYLSKEEDLSIFHQSGFISMVTEYQEVVLDSTSESGWKEFVNSIFVPTLQKLDTNSTGKISFIRYYLIEYFCRIGDKRCADDGLKSMKKNMIIPFYFVCSAIQYQANDGWKDFYQEIQKFNSSLPNYSAGCSSDKKKIKSLLANINPQNLTEHWTGTAIQIIISNRKTWPELFVFLKLHFAAMINKNSFMQWDKLVFSNLKNPKKLDKLITILKSMENFLDSETKELVENKIKSYELRLSVSNDILDSLKQWLILKAWDKRNQG